MTLRVPGYYAPHLKQSLFSPQILFMTSQPEGYLQLSRYAAMLKLPNNVTMTMSLDLHSRLFYMPSFQNVQQAADELLANLKLTSEADVNLS